MSELAAAALDDFLNILGKKKVEVEVKVEQGKRLGGPLEGGGLKKGGH